MRTRLFLGEAFRSITSNLSTTVAATLTVLIGMFLLGLFIALGTWVLSWTSNVKGEVVVKVFLTQNATGNEVNAVGNALAGMTDLVADVRFISREEALRVMKRREPELTANLASNPFPPSFEVQPRRAEDAGTIVERLQPLPPYVDKVTDGEETTDRILRTAKIIGAVFLIGSVILLVASTLLISNTIRLSIFSRRREIEVMKLVGATNWFVRGPFMLEGILCGLAGSVLAVVLLVVAKEFALEAIVTGDLTDEGDVQALSFPLMALVLVGASLVVGAAGSGITIRRFLRI